MVNLFYVGLAVLTIIILSGGYFYMFNHALIQNTSVTSTKPQLSSSSGTTTTTSQNNVTQKYIGVFDACNPAISSCSGTFGSVVYLIQSNDGSNWTPVSGFKTFNGSVPAVVRRGGTLYIYTPNHLTRYNISSGIETSQAVTLEYSNGTIVNGYGPSGGFVDPSPILNSNGTIILFYLPGIFGQDPAMCPTGQTSCTKYIMSATEMKGSNGGTFVIDPGYRASIQISGSGCCASDPTIFQGPSSYILYVSSTQSVLAFSSQQLQGGYNPVPGLQNGVLSSGNGGVPEGYYNPATQQYWTYVTYAPQQGGTSVIKLAITQNINSTIPSQAFSTIITGCSFKSLGCNYPVGSLSIYPNIANGTK